MPYVITAPCTDIKDKSCIEECPVACIYEGDRKFYINPELCIDCGACEPVCPVEATSQDRRVPDDQAEFVADNACFFTTVLPGRDEPIGTWANPSELGRVGADTDLVATYEAG